MERLPEFVGNHPLLSLAFVSILGALVWTFLQASARGLVRVGPPDAIRLINAEDAVVIDVRGDGDFDRGHILNAVHVPHNQIEQQMAKLEKYKERPVIVACGTGSVSAGVGGALRKRGFSRVHHLTGGIAAWESANLPLSRR